MLTHACFNGYWPPTINPTFAWYLFSDDAIAYLPLKHYLEENPKTFSLLDVRLIVEKEFPFFKETVRNGYDFAYRVFDLDEYYRLSPKEEFLDVFKKTKRAFGFFQRAAGITEDQRREEGRKQLLNRNPDICPVFGTYLADCVQSGLLPSESIEYLLFAYFVTEKNEADYIEGKILKLATLPPGEDYRGFFDTWVGKTLSEYGINTLQELTLCSPGKIQALFPFRVKCFCSEVSEFLPNEIELIAKGCEHLLEDLRSQEREVLKLHARYGFDGLKLKEGDKTKEGQLTSQVVRRIAKKAMLKLRSPIRRQPYFSALLPMFYGWFSENMNEYGLLSIATIKDALPNDDVFSSFLAIFVTDKENSFFEYNRSLGLICENHMKLDGVFKTIAQSMPLIIGQDNFNLLDPCIKNGLLSFEIYTMNDEGVYTRATNRKRADYLKLIERVFKNGYRLYSEDDYLRFLDEWEAEYGPELEAPSRPAVRGAIGENWQLMDDGVYQPRHKCLKLPEELFPPIYEFIERFLPAVYYRSIFFEFEGGLRDAGINNVAMFKGAFDAFDKKYKHARDYLKSKEWTGTCRDAIIEKAKSITVITPNKLREYFPHVEDYVFHFCLSKRDDVIRLKDECYLYIDETTFRADDLEDLAVFINGLFDSYKINCITVSRLYERFRIGDRTNLFYRLRYIVNESALLAVIDRFLNDRFETSSTLVWKKGTALDQMRLLLY